MKAEIRDALKYGTNLPTPPAIAIQLLELGRKPEISAAELVEIIRQDPAVTSRILRVSNSPLYARSRRSDTLQQAIMVLGMNTTVTLALSFSLAALMRDQAGGVVDWIWRRALISATVSQKLGEYTDSRRSEELFLAGLLQDIGILALQSQFRENYAPLLQNANGHDALIRAEQETLSCDHGEVGTWLMQEWLLPELIAESANTAHQSEVPPSANDDDKFLRCIWVSGRVADLFLNKRRRTDTASVLAVAEKHLGIPRETMKTLLEELAGPLREIEQLFEANVLNEQRLHSLMEQARELLTLRNLQVLQQLAEQQSRTAELERSSRRWQEEATRDVLTGLRNRRYFDAYLSAEFTNAVETGLPLVVGFLDLDHFKSINDRHGHRLGDLVLRDVARQLRENLRDTDQVVRYGGEEFVLVLPATTAEQGFRIFERLRVAVASADRKAADGTLFRVTTSIGMAVHMDGGREARSPLDLVHAADKALYRAKASGRNRVVASDGED